MSKNKYISVAKNVINLEINALQNQKILMFHLVMQL